MKVIYSGLESSGKSLMLAKEARRILLRNASVLKKNNIKRKIASNMKFSDSFEQLATRLGIEIQYWKDLDDLIELENCDVIMDEVGNYFDARGWQDLSLDVRRWLTQGAKCGVELYGSAQDFAQVDRSFRRLVRSGDLHYIRKMIGSRRPSGTRPPVKRIWGVCWSRTLDPMGYEEDKVKFTAGIFGLFTGWFLIRREDCETFDTNQKIVRSKPPPLKKEVRVCPEDGYTRTRYY